MAKRIKIENMDQAQVEAEVATTLASIAEKRAAYKKLGDAIVRDSDRLKALEAQRTKFVPVTLESALVCILETGENAQGYQFLQDRSYKGEWKDTGLRDGGQYWPATNQRALTVWSNNAWDDAKLKEQERLILEVLPLIKAGAFEKGEIALSSKRDAEKVEKSSLKIFLIFDRGLSAHSSWKLAAMEDGRWMIFDEYSCKYSWGSARKVGTLQEMLKEIRAYLYYEGPRDEDEDQD